MAGRPSKLTPECRKDLEDAIRLGATYEDAATYAGIDYSTFARWMARGREAQSGEFRDFHDAITHAQSRGKVMLLAKIEAAASDGDWRAAAWKLERRDPVGYGATQKVQHSGDPDGSPIRHEVKSFADLVALAGSDESASADDPPADGE